MQLLPPHHKRDLTHLLTEDALAERLATSIGSVRTMRRKGRLRCVRLAGNRKIRFWWPQVLEDLSLTRARTGARQS